jgi:hypothetical protein
VSVAEASRGGPVGGPPAADPAARVPRRRRRWRWLAGPAVLAVLAGVAIVLTVLGAAYQPITYGDVWTNFPGLPTGTGIRPVNTFAQVRADYYVPPQRGEFSFFASIRNNGPRAVTILAVTLAPGSDGSPMRLAAPVRYSRPDDQGYGQSEVPSASRVLHQVTLGAGQEIFIGIPLRTWPCAQTDSWLTVPSFYVREHFLFFTHTVAIAWNMQGGELIMHAPGGHAGDPDTFCAGK